MIFFLHFIRNVVTTNIINKKSQITMYCLLMSMLADFDLNNEINQTIKHEGIFKNTVYQYVEK